MSLSPFFADDVRPADMFAKNIIFCFFSKKPVNQMPTSPLMTVIRMNHRCTYMINNQKDSKMSKLIAVLVAGLFATSVFAADAAAPAAAPAADAPAAAAPAP